MFTSEVSRNGHDSLKCRADPVQDLLSFPLRLAKDLLYISGCHDDFLTCKNTESEHMCIQDARDIFLL